MEQWAICLLIFLPLILCATPGQLTIVFFSGIHGGLTGGWVTGNTALRELLRDAPLSAPPVLGLRVPRSHRGTPDCWVSVVTRAIAAIAVGSWHCSSRTFRWSHLSNWPRRPMGWWWLVPELMQGVVFRWLKSFLTAFIIHVVTWQAKARQVSAYDGGDFGGF